MTFKSSRGGSSEPKHPLHHACFRAGGAIVCQRPAPAGRPATISVESYCLGERGPARGIKRIFPEGTLHASISKIPPRPPLKKGGKEEGFEKEGGA